MAAALFEAELLRCWRLPNEPLGEARWAAETATCASFGRLRTAAWWRRRTCFFRLSAHLSRSISSSTASAHAMMLSARSCGASGSAAAALDGTDGTCAECEYLCFVATPPASARGRAWTEQSTMTLPGGEFAKAGAELVNCPELKRALTKTGKLRKKRGIIVIIGKLVKDSATSFLVPRFDSGQAVVPRQPQLLSVGDGGPICRRQRDEVSAASRARRAAVKPPPFPNSRPAACAWPLLSRSHSRARNALTRRSGALGAAVRPTLRVQHALT